MGVVIDHVLQVAPMLKFVILCKSRVCRRR